MRASAAHVIEQLIEAFPQRIPEGVVVPHECEECASIRVGLLGRAWGEISGTFAEDFADGLPLLSADGYNAYLPVWLRAAVESPDGEAAAMVGINLANKPSQSGFTSAQARAMLAAVRYVACNASWGDEDEINMCTIAAVEATWADLLA